MRDIQSVRLDAGEACMPSGTCGRRPAAGRPGRSRHAAGTGISTSFASRTPNRSSARRERRAINTPEQILAKKTYRRSSGNLHETGNVQRQQGELPALKCILSYPRYGGDCVPESSRHRPATRAIPSNNVRQPETIAFKADNCATGDVVRAGRFSGDFLPALSRSVVGSRRANGSPCCRRQATPLAALWAARAESLPRRPAATSVDKVEIVTI